MPSSLGRYCFLHAGFPCCLSTNACADGQGSLSQAALPKAAMFDAVAIVLCGIIAIYWHCEQRALRALLPFIGIVISEFCEALLPFIGVVISELWTPLEAEIASLFG